KLNAPRATIRFGAQNELAPNPVFAVATGAGAVWVTRGNHLVRIDHETGEPDAEFPIPAPVAIAVGDGAVWVTTQDERLLRLDPRTGMPTGSLTLPAIGYAVAVGPNAGWVAGPLRNRPSR